MSPEDYGRMLAEREPPITHAQAVAAARILAEDRREREQLGEAA